MLDAVDKEHLRSRFPGSTDGDIYMWLVRHLDEMKRVDALSTEIDAARDAKEKDKRSFIARWVEYLKDRLSRK